MKIAITGGSGEIGGFTIQHFLEQGHEVRNLDLQEPENSFCPFRPVDITDAEAMEKALQGVDAVLHLAAIIYPQQMAGHRLYQINHLGTWNVLDACAKLSIHRIALASSFHAVGLSYNPPRRFDYFPMDEAHPSRPDEAYGLSKLNNESLADGFSRRFPEMRISSLRYPAVYTPRQYPQGPEKSGLAITSLWTWADIRDIARANLLALEVPGRGHEVFFLNSGQTLKETPTRELVQKHYPEVPFREDLIGNASLISPAKAEKLLGWKMEKSFAQFRAEEAGN